MFMIALPALCRRTQRSRIAEIWSDTTVMSAMPSTRLTSPRAS
jgi:hypothetical protein